MIKTIKIICPQGSKTINNAPNRDGLIAVFESAMGILLCNFFLNICDFKKNKEYEE